MGEQIFPSHTTGAEGRKSGEGDVEDRGTAGASVHGPRDSRGPGPQEHASWTRDRPRHVHTLNQLQVWRTAIGKFTGSHPAAAPEAKYRKRRNRPSEPRPRSSCDHIPHGHSLGLASQETPVKRISMVTTWKAPQ